MKKINFIHLSVILLFFTIGNASQVKANYLTFSEINTELTNNGYSEISLPANFTPSWNGATVHYYVKSGVNTGVFVYQYSNVAEIPAQVSNDCVHKATSYVDNTVSPPVIVTGCQGSGNECRYVIKTSETGKPNDCEIICCG